MPVIAHPIDVAWVSTGGTGAQNYDEFASDAEIEAIIARHPDSVLAVEMPHCVPEARIAGLSFTDALPAAAQRLADLRAGGRFERQADVVALYRITSELAIAYGVLLMVDTDQISTSADDPGQVIRNEDVFSAKVAERTALIKGLQHLLSPVLLVQSEGGGELEDQLAALVSSMAEPTVSDTDQLDQVHELWLLPEGAEREAVLAAVNTGQLVVADGNHRTLAAQQAGLPRFLAVITTPGSVHIRPYNRLVRTLGMAPEEFVDALRAAGAQVAPWEGEVAVPVLPGTVAVVLPHGQTYAVTLPHGTDGTVVDRLDHSVVERVVLGGILGLGPDDARISYVGGDYPVEWLTGEVDAGRADAAIVISPVSVQDFLAVNLERLKMPRKSTWFSPKARAGLILAELPG
ncbi:MAG: DUF1015 domain-containing protein [Pseudonocardiales bacterium]|nr:MAG: DUF1015 domain-containing protein [Pseudonocardiales bacterium]